MLHQTVFVLSVLREPGDFNKWVQKGCAVYLLFIVMTILEMHFKYLPRL